jgi:aspartyl-tRNA(Asn)/glutamyl-tRNA(Gln) amidotransferase subunit C
MHAQPEEEDLVRRTAALARLSIGGEEAARLGRDFERILAAFRDLATLDLAGAEGMERGGGDEAPLRPDEPAPAPPSLGAELVLRAAPQREDAFFGVPKTLGGRA